MRVFVAGGTGAIGRPLLPRLAEAGHDVTAMTRSPERAAELRERGFEAVVADALDAGAVREAVVAARPEVVVHQLTGFSGGIDYSRPETFEPTIRLRRDGTRHLVDAAQAAGARRLIAQSIAFMFVPEGGPVKDEDAPMRTDIPIGAATVSLEEQVTGAEGVQGLVLRYGMFYGPGTGFARDGAQAAEVRRRRFPIVGRGEGILSFIHVDDAAAATVAAVEHGAPGIYNIVDDEPALMRDWLPAYAEAIGAPRPLRVPKFLARLVAGSEAVRFMTETRGASNEKAKRELAWQPSHASWREGFRTALG